MISREAISRMAVRSALEARKEANKSWDTPICIYDVAELLKAEVWFVGGATFSGMYAKDYGRLFVPAERPNVRRTFTCAHELAHFRFNHGSRVEELDFETSDYQVPEEILANSFASNILMPRQAVVKEFELHGCLPSNSTPIEIYAIACQLGVGYETLVRHLQRSLKLITEPEMEKLLSTTPKGIRKSVLGKETPTQMVLVRSCWHSIAIDLEVGDLAVIPGKLTLDGNSARKVGECLDGNIVEAIKPGLVQALDESSEWAAMVRVSRRQFTGRGMFRHLEDPDEGA